MTFELQFLARKSKVYIENKLVPLEFPFSTILQLWTSILSKSDEKEMSKGEGTFGNSSRDIIENVQFLARKFKVNFEYSMET